MQALSDFRAANHESVTVSSTAIGIASTVSLSGETIRGQRALITCEDAQIRYTTDGTTPTTTVGHLLEAGQSIEVIGYADIDAFQAIRTGGTDGVLKVTLEIF